MFGCHWLPAEVLSTNRHLPEVIHTIGLYSSPQCVCRRFAVARDCRVHRPATPLSEVLLGLARPGRAWGSPLCSWSLSLSPVSAAHTPPHARLQIGHGIPYANLGYPEKLVPPHITCYPPFTYGVRWVGSSLPRASAVALLAVLGSFSFLSFSIFNHFLIDALRTRSVPLIPSPALP